jgi:hypothetical protein
LDGGGMMRFRLWLLLSLLTACSSLPQGNSPQAICKRESYDDPRVKQMTEQGTQLNVMSPKAQFDYQNALRNAYQACLLKHGVAVQGGVEPVRPSY